MPWLLMSPGHQQPWYCLCRIGRFLSYLMKDFNYLRLINLEKWHKRKIYMFMFPLKNLARTGLRYIHGKMCWMREVPHEARKTWKRVILIRSSGPNCQMACRLFSAEPLSKPIGDYMSHSRSLFSWQFYVAFRSLMKNETTNDKKIFRFQKETVNNLVLAPTVTWRKMADWCCDLHLTLLFKIIHGHVDIMADTLGLTKPDSRTCAKHRHRRRWGVSGGGGGECRGREGGGVG